jgi:outer membrane protein assembly factor BamA
VNNPYNATRGYSFTGTFEFTGGFLGGDINFYRPSGEFRYYKPMNHGRNTLAMRMTGSFVQSFTNLSVPFYERFFAGGDFDIRGFDFRTISPISFITRTLPAQFLPGTNSGLRMSTGIELQLVLPVLNAPFRIDYALNPMRIDRNFNGPVTGIPFGIHQPGHGFKFTVGRTF